MVEEVPTTPIRPTPVSPTEGGVPTGILIILALVTMVGPLSINAYLSGLPHLAEEFSISTALAQLTVTAFLIGNAVGQLVMGPVSDGLGRHRLLLTGLGFLLVASTAVALSPNIWVVYVARLIQGFAAGTAIALARAVAADMATGTALAKAFSLLMLIGGIAPVVGPVIGGFLVAAWGWRSVFWMIAIFAAVDVVLVLTVLKETLPAERRSGVGLKPMFHGFAVVLRDRTYRRHTAGYIFSFCAMFAYVAASPFVLQTHFGFTPIQYALTFAGLTAVMTLVSFGNSKIVGKYGALRLARIGNAVTIAGSVAVLIAALLNGPAWVVIAFLAVVVGVNGANMGNNSALAIEPVRTTAGAASALMGAGQFIAAGAVSPLVGIFSGFGVSQPVAMGVLMVAASLIAATGIQHR